MNCYAFTTTSNQTKNKLQNVSKISADGVSMDARTLWDTGATCSCISHEVADSLDLVPTGVKRISTPSGTTDVCTFLVDITLPNNVIISDLQVCESDIGVQGLDFLAGMDIINKGDFSVSNYNGKTVFTFRIPSQKTTDYVHEENISRLVGPIHGKGKRKKKKR